MEDTYRMDPHILRRVLDADREEVASVPIQNEARTEAQPALLIFPNREEAVAMVGHWSSADHEPTPVSPEDIEEVCKNHGMVLVAFWGILHPFDLEILSVETVPLIFGEVG
jgi:hypothetical protein